MFKTEPLFVLGCSHAALSAYLHKRFKVDAGDDVGQIGQMLTYSDKAPYRVVWAKSLALPPILHEVFHLVTRICADKGIPIRAHNEHGENADETAAYLFEFFATDVLRRVRR